MTPLLQVNGLTTRFQTERGLFTAVDNVSFSVEAGQTLAIVGESGSGKSVTAMSIMRLIPQPPGRIEAGEVLLEGRNLLALSEREMRQVRGNRMAMIFQEPMTSLNPALTIGFQIAEALRLHRGMDRAAAKAETVRLLEKVRIPAAASRFDEHPHRLSGGMRQRVMIAMALACRPKLLIADEPTTALDVTIQAQILELIKTLQEEEGMAVLFITHDMGVVAEIAHRTVVMYQGRAVEAGTTEQLFARAEHPYTRSLLAAVPRLGAMNGRGRPMRFPVVDRDTGLSDEPVEVADTVAADAAPLLEVSNLTTRFDIRGGVFGRTTGRVHAVENVSFSLQPGETLSLVGESGCGKTSTGRSILRLDEPLAGSVKLGGQNVLTLPAAALRDQRRHMQMIFQDPFASLNPRMTVGDAIAEPLLIHRLATPDEARAQVAELLQRVGLAADMAVRYPHEFSGGQRQRICIARALALKPQLIVADESVSALDVSVKAQVINLMLDLQAQMKLAYLFISHDMAVVERISHRVAVMYLGEIVEIGRREQVFGNPQHPYTKRLLAAVPIADPARRLQHRPVSNDEIRSPIRPPDYQPPERVYREVSADHQVMVWDESWEANRAVS
ncbi:glutathione ABC transporter ATP-binding protein GsiA [Comamonas serinivorans]|uniref:Glutathione import ATP-binding protein GsiA n=1 Tax=Comamonas serinivorans TaxID=1082851 RepID=A0A1Y0EMF2_9BURK|nr:ABC transporter ATP-binding protein [Comamonas serinivorans]ARU04834.1 glutathione ABC transporter ATP-binding protein GsiA [Comamonas serinivorans]